MNEKQREAREYARFWDVRGKPEDRARYGTTAITVTDTFIANAGATCSCGETYLPGDVIDLAGTTRDERSTGCAACGWSGDRDAVRARSQIRGYRDGYAGAPREGDASYERGYVIGARHRRAGRKAVTFTVHNTRDDVLDAHRKARAR